MGIAFAATIGGFGTLVGSPTNAIAVGIIEQATGYRIDFLTWALFGMPLVLISIPLVLADPDEGPAGRSRPTSTRPRRAPGSARPAPGRPPRSGWCRWSRWSSPAWVALPFVTPYLPKDSLTDGTIAIVARPAAVRHPGRHRPAILNWDEANRAPWGVIMMFGGGLALAAGIGESGLAEWLGVALQPLRAVPPV